MVEASQIKARYDLLDYIGRDVRLKHVARTGGGEYAGSCPFCGGKDRFRVQPYYENGRWYCRGCGDNKWHDIFDYIQKMRNCSFMDAIDILSGGSTSQHHRPTKEDPAPPIDDCDRGRWEATAKEFMNDCIIKLWDPANIKALNYLQWRGLSDQSIIVYRLGYNPAEGYGKPEEWGYPPDKKIYIPRGIVIPCVDDLGFHYLKIRRNKADPPYLMLQGSAMWLFGGQTFKNYWAYLFESELDAILAHQVGCSLGYGSIPAGQPLKQEYAPYFEPIEDLIVCFDDDDPGRKAAKDLCKLSKRFHRATPLPDGKDITEYYQITGSYQAVFDWLYDQIEEASKHGS